MEETRTAWWSKARPNKTISELVWKIKLQEQKRNHFFPFVSSTEENKGWREVVQLASLDDTRYSQQGTSKGHNSLDTAQKLPAILPLWR